MLFKKFATHPCVPLTSPVDQSATRSTSNILVETVRCSSAEAAAPARACLDLMFVVEGKMMLQRSRVGLKALVLFFPSMPLIHMIVSSLGYLIPQQLEPT